MDFAKRAYDHSFPFDPIIRNLLDIDFYKLLMLQFVWRFYRTVHASFSVINRTKSIRLADDVDIDELRRQLDHVKTLKFEQDDRVWLAGQTFYGQTGIFCPEFIEYLRSG